MGRGKLAALTVVTILVIGAVWAGILVRGLEPRLGLDLQGGVSANLIPAPGQGDVDTGVLDQTVSIIRERVDALGVAEPEIARQGDTIQVQLPGVADQETAREVIGRTAQLQFRPVLQVIPPGPAAEPTASAAPTASAEPTAAVAPTATPEPTADATPTTAQRRAVAGVATPTATATLEQTATATPSATPAPTATPSEAATADPVTIPTETTNVDPSDAPDCSEDRGGAVPAPDEQVILCERAFAPATAPGELPEELPRDQWNRLVLGPARVLGTDVDSARAEPDQTLGVNWGVSLGLSDEGAERFATVTGELACAQGVQRQLAVVLDDVVEYAPPVADTVLCGSGIEGGLATITVGGGEQEAKQLALILRAGALPIQLDFGTFQTVSPTLGRDALQGALLAGLVGLILVAIYLTVLYRGMGAAAVLELVVFGVTITGLIIWLGDLTGFTLTLAGIAGVIVSVGIAADSSIIYRERYRDEIRAGRTIRTAAEAAWSKAFRTNLSGNIVSFLGAAILYVVAVGPVRGFAFTLGLATLVDLALYCTFTRGLFGLIARTPALATSPAMGLRHGVIMPATTPAGERRRKRP